MKSMKILFFSFFLITVFGIRLSAGNQDSFSKRNESLHFISTTQQPGAIQLAGNGQAATILVSETDYPGVTRVAMLLRNDIRMVSNILPPLYTDLYLPVPVAIIAGTVGKSRLIDQLVAEGKLNVDDIRGKWENTLIEVIDNPLPGIEHGLIIAGSDKRATMFGMLEISKQIGVSPWYFWADVPVKKHPELYAKRGRYNFGEPAVKYRGIFINDEAPALSGWVHERYGKFGHEFYVHVFELILRLKGNLLWPAMWGRAFYDDDGINPLMANDYGIVIGTSHHEPMMRAHVEWQRYGDGPWNYQTNTEKLREFWRHGIERMGDNESIVTLAMRGDGDEPMSRERNIDLLTQIVDDQRKIITEVTGKPADEIPQVWALYKEVQEYYDLGMRVPDDVTLLYCDDNWGNIRRVPGEKEKLRKGGSGMYYHFDYVGGPRNYKWLNTNPIPRVWEQMKLTYDHQIDRLWIVNVGDIKPMELPISFFLDMAWNPAIMTLEDMSNYTYNWVNSQFGSEYALEITSVLDGYTKIFGRRKPELVDWKTYSLIHYRDFERAVAEFNSLANLASYISEKLDPLYYDAYYQLVQYPAEAGSNLYNLYFSAALNHLYAKQRRSLANPMAGMVKYHFDTDAGMTRYFHHGFAKGKWNHMMSQTRIGYSSWQEPKMNIIPSTDSLEIPNSAIPGLQIEGIENEGNGDLPTFDNLNDQRFYLEIFNKGSVPFDYKIKATSPLIQVSKTEGRITSQERIWVAIDWKNTPNGLLKEQLIVETPVNSFTVGVNTRKLSDNELSSISGFVEANGYISIEAEDFSRKVETGGIEWTIISNLGYSKSGVIALPYKAAIQEPGSSSYLEYPVHLFDGGEVTVYAHFSPTLNYTGGEGFKYALSFNNEKPQVVNIHQDESMRAWERIVANNITVGKTTHILKPGNHVLKFHMVNPGLVLQKLVIDTGGLKKSYLGPEPSFFKQ